MTIANGWTVISLPCPWAWTQMDWTIRVPVTENMSPFTGQTAQVIKWPGADGWLVTVTTPPIPAEQIGQWRAFFWNAQGGANAFLLGDPLGRTPQGTVNTPILVNGAHSAMATRLNLKGFRSNQPRVLLHGDLLSVNYRLHTVCDPYVSADVNGDATVTIGPSLREALTDGMAVSTKDAQGLFRLVKSDIQFHIDDNRMYTTSFACKEAR